MGFQQHSPASGSSIRTGLFPTSKSHVWLIVLLALILPCEETAAGGSSGVPTSLQRFLQADYLSDSENGRIHFNGEVGAAFFDTGPDGEFPAGTFRVDEAKLFVEAVVADGIYAFGEINFFQREEGAGNVSIGELYLEFEDVSKLWNQERQLNVRVGRFDIPFGEEYLTRDAIDNPLISHSLMDVWGVDEGIELYGFLKRFEYVVAIQNGGEAAIEDFNPDKAVAARLLYRISTGMHISFSAMRTGDLDVEQDRFSEVWFGNGFLRVLGSPLTTTEFNGRLFQGDAHAAWERGHIHFAAGALKYDDNDSIADHRRNLHYFQMEGLQKLNDRKEGLWYLAARFSRITAENGFPLVGHGDFARFLFNDDFLTEELWRASFGPGYRVGRNFLFKMEYSFENGKLLNGTERDQENFFGFEVAARF